MCLETMEMVTEDAEYRNFSIGLGSVKHYVRLACNSIWYRLYEMGLQKRVYETQGFCTLKNCNL